MQTLILCALALWITIGLIIGFILSYPDRHQSIAEKFGYYTLIFRSRYPRWTDQRVWAIAEYYATFERAIVMGTSLIFWPLVLEQARRLWGKNAGL